MPNTIDIDTGGTFTDCFVSRNGEIRTVKVPTTPHDLTVCFLEGIEAGAAAFGISADRLLYETQVIRFSNTIGTNTIIERTGAKVGLLVSAGYEGTAPCNDDSGKAPLVEGDMVIGLDEDTGPDGSVHKQPTSTAILAAAQTLIDKGARCLVVAFNHSDACAENERLVRATVKQEYPRDYLGSVPVFLASDITPRPGAAARLHTAVVNAYIHAKLARLLYKAGEDLRRSSYQNTLLIGHNNGTVARVAKTRAINTYNSGPAAGLLGAREVGRVYGIDNLITTDMGGTSFDIGYVAAGQPGYALAPDIEGFPCSLPMLDIRAFGAGGGSIASVDAGKLAVGPRSAGAAPGPACFNLGGTAPTLTDANVVLGILDPAYFLGGTIGLDRDKAVAAIAETIARPLGTSTEDAAHAIRRQVELAMGREVVAIAAKLPDPAAATIVAYGGAGAIHACDIAAAAGLGRLIITAHSAVSSAYSSSLLDAGHLYYRQIDRPLETGIRRVLDDALQAMRRIAERDMRGEGFASDAVRFDMQFFVRDAADETEILVSLPGCSLSGTESVARIGNAAAARLAREPASADFVVTTVGLLASAAIPHVENRSRPRTTLDVGAAQKASREVYLDPARGFEAIGVFERERLQHGHALEGPVLVESAQTTLLVPHGWHLEIDEYDNAILEVV